MPKPHKKVTVAWVGFGSIDERGPGDLVQKSMAVWGCSGGLVVSVIASYYYDPSSNPADY